MPEVERAAQDRPAGRPAAGRRRSSATGRARSPAAQAAAPAAAVRHAARSGPPPARTAARAELDGLGGIGRHGIRGARILRSPGQFAVGAWLCDRFGHWDSDRRAATWPTLAPHVSRPRRTLRARPRRRGADRKERQDACLDPPAERPRRPVGPNGGALGAPDLTVPDNQVFGANVFSPAVQRQRLPKDVFKPPAGHARARRGARHLARRRGRAGDEGVGAREGRHPLHALVPAADRLDRREARQLLRARPARARRWPSSPARS